MNYLLNGQQSERLEFRKLMAGDFDECLKFFEEPLSNRYWKSKITEPKALCNEWFEKQLWRYQNGKGGTNVLIHKQSKGIVGWCGLLIQKVDNVEELEVGYSILPKFWNNGYATEAARKCIDFAFEKDLRESVIAIIQVNNIESQRVAIKIGMEVQHQTSYNDNEVTIYRINKTN